MRSDILVHRLEHDGLLFWVFFNREGIQTVELETFAVYSWVAISLNRALKEQNGDVGNAEWLKDAPLIEHQMKPIVSKPSTVREWNRLHPMWHAFANIQASMIGSRLQAMGLERKKIE